MNEYIPVSGVIACHICPRRYYFERSDEIPESPRYTVCKQVSMHLWELLDPEEIWSEVLCILRGIDIPFHCHTEIFIPLKVHGYANCQSFSRCHTAVSQK